jgi:hypothetical protein
MISNYSRRALRQSLNQRARWNTQQLYHPGRQQRPPLGLSSTADLHTFALAQTDKDEEQRQKRLYHSTVPSERVVAAMMGLATISAVAYAGSSAAKSYEEWKAAQPSPEEVEETRKADEAAQNENEAEQAKTQNNTQDQKDETSSDQPRENFFKSFFDVGTKYYEGGFDDKMTKREAALVLGVRESASKQRIRDAHRKLLILNHPDTGGSTYLSGKLNEAKELLLKGKARM